MTRTARAAAILAALLIATVGLASTASAQSYAGSSVAVSSNNVTCGANLTGTGTGWAPGIPVFLTVQSTPVSLPPVIPDADGNFTVEFTSPADPGAHTLTAVQTVDGATITRVTEFTCSETSGGGAARAVTPAGALPFTGGDSAPLVQLGVALLAVGALVVLIVRKRRSA
jgi:hypothetical protein